MFTKIIQNLPKQFAYEPEVKNSAGLAKKDRLIVVGMGGSHLAADLLKAWRPNLDLTIHSNYGLPFLPANALEQSLIILSSYSGNTEEVIDSFREAVQRKLAHAVIASGGELLELAKKEGSPYIILPDTGIEPRFALGYSLKALLKLIGDDEGLTEISKLADTFNPLSYEKDGEALAERLKGFVPIIYSSRRNRAIAYNWKIKFNETAKIPAFFNLFPELNHNEMNGFDANHRNRELIKKFYFLIIKDKNDEPRILKRMEILEKMYKEKGLSVAAIEINGQPLFQKVFSALALIDWATYYLAKYYGVNPEGVPIVKEFKKLMRE